MKTSHRARWEWGIFLRVNLISAVISAFFSYAIRHDEDSSIWVAFFIGAFTSLLIATPLLLYELKGQRLRFVRRLRRLPLALYFGLKVVLYLAVIISGLLISRTLSLPLTHDPNSFDSIFRVSIVFSVVMSLTLNLVFAVGGLLGYSTFKNLLTGRYVQPKREERTFLLIDMKDSTGLAERLGPIRFHELLNAFFTDVTEAALECDAEIHKYVGDEVILTWPTERALVDGECLACPFLARDLIAANGELYRKNFGVTPEFRAALHCGEIVTGEIGDVRREIAYVGDTLNVAARLLEATKASGRDVLVSAELLARTALPAGVVTEPLPTLSVRGREAPLKIAALSRA
jgi:adenylate cyclase